MRLVTFTTASGDDVVVQVADEAAPPGGPVVRGWTSSQVEAYSERKLDEVLAKVQPAIGSLVQQARDLVDAPDSIEVQFGVQLSLEVGAFITASSVSNFQITMRWTSPRPA